MFNVIRAATSGYSQGYGRKLGAVNDLGKKMVFRSGGSGGAKPYVCFAVLAAPGLPKRQKKNPQI